jgi:NADH-quinone oxidoreductase subunit N
MNFAQLFSVTLPETALEIAALLVLIIDLGILRKATLTTRVTIASLVGIAGCIAALVYLPCAGSAGFSYGDELLLASGGITAVAQAGILVLTLLTLALFIGSTFTRHAAEYVAVVLMAAAGGLLVASAQDLLIIFVGLELLSLGLYVLTAFNKYSEKSSEAALKYYLFGGMSAAFLLFGFSYLYGIAGSTNLHQIMRAAFFATASGGTSLVYVALVLVLAGLGFKVAAVPFQLWAPDTYEGAPAPAAAFIASASKVASFALLISIGTAAIHIFDGLKQIPLTADQAGTLPAHLGLEAPWVLILCLMAAASMIGGNLAALAQISVRRLLAYSAIAHAGYMLLGVAYLDAGTKTAQAILYYVLTYGLTTIGAFGVIQVVETATGSNKLDAFLGLHKRNPVLAAVMLVLFLSLAGIPPLVGFWAKFNLFAAVLQVSAGPVPFVLVALAIAMSAVSLYYYLQVLKRAYVMPAVDETRIKAHPVTLLVLVTIAAAVVLSGCLPAILQTWIGNGRF